MDIIIIGGGPAGLRAAEVAASGGSKVTLFDAKPSVGRKFLVAGRGGLNLTKEEAFPRFCTRYSGTAMPENIWASLLGDFDSNALRNWASALGVETFVASTGRIYPKQLKASVLLRRWVQRLRALGVSFKMNHRWIGLEPQEDGRILVRFEVKEESQTAPRTVEETSDRVILALGGGSWPETGSTGAWVSPLASMGIQVHPLHPANCGWEYPWPDQVLEAAEGKPLKNIAVRVNATVVAGELMVTNYGLEGGALYQVGPMLRSSKELIIDFKPISTREELLAKLGSAQGDLLHLAAQRWRLSEPTVAILTHCAPPCETKESLVDLVKNFPLTLTRPRPIEEAISSAGGVSWSELDENLMLKKLPGVFVAGEMIDWEAPTGGYLLQGCFATGTRVGKAAASL